MKHILTFCLVATSCAFSDFPCPSADDHQPQQPMHPSDCPQEPEPVCCPERAYDNNRECDYYRCLDPCDEITPSAGPRTRDGANAYIEGTFLYWTVREEGLEFVLRGVNDAGVTGRDYIKEPDFRTEPGFKIALGWQMPHDGWDMLLRYTWLKGKGNRRSTGTNMQSAWFQPIINSIEEASTSWHLQFNNFDFEMGRNFYASRFLTMRPFAGFKGGWHDEDYKVRYLDALNENAGFYDRVHMDNFIWYLGLRAGCNTNWYFSKHWSVYGNTALSANWARFKIERLDQQYLPQQSDLRVDTTNTVQAYHSIFPVLELGIGLEWETFFSDDDYHIALSVGWEEQVWWGHNYFPAEQQAQANHGDLTMQGLNFTIRFDF